MPQRRLAERLASAESNRERRRLAANISLATAIAVGRELRAICYETWTSEPLTARSTSTALEALFKQFPNDEIRANAFWVAGIAAITRGRFERAADDLDSAARIFRRLGSRSEAANTQIAKLIALALRGRYDDALRVGRAALRSLAELGDELAAGKIEMNLSNIVSRRDKHRDAERFCLSALSRFEGIGDATWETMALNGLANTYSELNDFLRAERFYERALAKAQTGQMLKTEAEIEASMGKLAQFRGRFSDALRLLETSRGKYDKLRMPHESAIAELEMAEIYLELNLTGEAAAIFDRTAKRLRKLGLTAEEARAATGLGRAAFRQNEPKRARAALKRAAGLFVRDKNYAGAAAVFLAAAEVELARRDHRPALELIAKAEIALAKSENVRQTLSAKWLRAEAYRKAGRNRAATKLLTNVLAAALESEQSSLAQVCLNSLGSLAIVKGDSKTAEHHFERAIELIEKARAPLPGEEFRMSFLADKLAPYENLAKVQIESGDYRTAFETVERAKARTLSETIGDGRKRTRPAKFENEHQQIREELNWFYNRLKRADAAESAKLEINVRRLEKQLAELERKRSSLNAPGSNRSSEFSLAPLQKWLGKTKALIEFVNFGSTFSAFVVGDHSVEFVPEIAGESEILELLGALQFQFGALRYGGSALGPFTGQLKTRADHYLELLGERLFAPLAGLVGERDIIVVPTGALNYVPFHALRRGRYLLEDREVSFAPSAAVAMRLANKKPRALGNALLVGYADERIPLVNDEIARLAESIPGSETLTGEDATFANYQRRSGDFDALHLACHGQFRPDNPLFSSLHLADGFVTVRDICAQRLKARVVTLSACETGLSKIFAGDEILGLARGFLAAGAQSLVLSLWTVNDTATARLMIDFYDELQRGASVSASLRKAQMAFVDRGEHPYFWSPFMTIC
jgi:tetratricopeptide (TPR) repeat protein